MSPTEKYVLLYLAFGAVYAGYAAWLTNRARTSGNAKERGEAAEIDASLASGGPVVALLLFVVLALIWPGPVALELLRVALTPVRWVLRGTSRGLRALAARLEEKS